MIANGEELALLSQLINDPSGTLTVDGAVRDNTYLRKAHYKLTADIKLNDTTNWQNWTTVINPTNSFKPIGCKVGSTHNLFSGVFDGDSHTIAGLFYSNTSAGTYVGLFGIIYGAEIKNVGVIESSIFGHKSGAIVANIHLDETIPEADRARSKITNCYNKGNVTGADIQVGGIAGSTMLATIEDCYNTGTVTSKGNGGGIAGSTSRNVIITNCYNEGTIVSSGSVATDGILIGGIVGAAGTGTDITKCYNTAEIFGTKEVGGIVGGGDNGYGKSNTEISECYNTGSINATNGIAGGISGKIVGFTNIKECYNTGNVKSTSATDNYAGGIVGWNDSKTNEPCTIYNSYNSGKIECGNMAAGGIAGNNANASEIINCYNIGEVSAANANSGGIASTNVGASKIVNCYNIGEVSAANGNTGGIVGLNASMYGDKSAVENCYNSGNVSGAQVHVGGVVGNPQTSTSFIKNNYYLKGCAKDGNNVVQNGLGSATKGAVVADTTSVTTGFAASNDGSNGGEDGDGTFGTAITVDSTPGVTSLLSALNIYVTAKNSATADKYLMWYQGKLLSLYPDFVAAQIFTMTFDANTGSGLMASQNFTDGIPQNIAANTFTKALHKFSGWNTLANGSGTAYTAGQSATLTENITLYAQWTALAQYTVTFDANGGTGSMTSQTFYEGTAQNITANTLTKTGYKFSGWNTLANGSGTAYTAGQSATLTGNITLYAQWTALAQYTVTFDANTGTGSMTSQMFYAETAQNITANGFTKALHKFSGWNTLANGSGTAYTAGQSATLTGNITLYAQWTALAQYTVTFDANGGTGSMTSQTFYEGTAQNITANTLTKTGYKFSGWNTLSNGSGTAYTDGQSVTLATGATLYAQWELLQQYNVTYNANGGTGLMDNQVFIEGSAQPILANIFTKDGYSFIGWNTMANGSGIAYNIGQSVVIAADVTLYAQWKTVFVVSFDSNNGTGSMDSQTFLEAVEQALPKMVILLKVGTQRRMAAG